MTRYKLRVLDWSRAVKEAREIVSDGDYSAILSAQSMRCEGSGIEVWAGSRKVAWVPYAEVRGDGRISFAP